jgi:putative PIN family toxin of toxin-antitoxin system
MMVDDGARPLLVIDTNIVLDLLVFEDLAQATLRDAVQQGQVVWLATQAMRDELARVLVYPQVARRLLARHLPAQEVLVQFDNRSRRVLPAARAPVRCRDPDDQIFIDLAVAHRAELLSKDAMVLRLRKRLAALGVAVASQRGAAGPAGL